MPAVDQKFVERLDDFTKSLESVVDLLKEQSKKDNQDPVNKMLAGMDKNLSKLVQEIKDYIKESSDRAEKNNKEMLAQIKSIREYSLRASEITQRQTEFNIQKVYSDLQTYMDERFNKLQEDVRRQVELEKSISEERKNKAAIFAKMDNNQESVLEEIRNIREEEVKRYKVDFEEIRLDIQKAHNDLTKSLDERLEKIEEEIKKQTEIQKAITSSKDKKSDSGKEQEKMLAEIKKIKKDEDVKSATKVQKIEERIKKAFDGIFKKFSDKEKDGSKTESSIKKAFDSISKKFGSKEKEESKIVNIVKKSFSDLNKKLDDKFKKLEDNDKKQIDLLNKINSAKKEKGDSKTDITEVSSKKKILDAVAMIGLIAVGVLAIGLAFKIIGKVDVLSVIGLGIAIGAIVGAYVLASKKLEEEKVDLKKVTMVGAIMVILAGALVVSSLILKGTANVTFKQSMTIGLVALALGASIYAIGTAVEKTKLEKKDIWKFLLLPIIVPLVAGSIVVSSIILKATVPLTIMQAISIGFVGLALGLAMYGVMSAVHKMEFKAGDIFKLMLLPVIVPLIAMGIVLASKILKFTEPISLGTVFAVVLVSAAMFAASYSVKPILKNLKDVNWGDIPKLPVMMAAIATGIAASSWILSAGNYKNAPPLMWTIQAGGALVGFALIIKLIDKFFGTKVKKEDVTVSKLDFESLTKMASGVGMVLIVAAAIMLSSWIISAGNYENAPPFMWTLSVGLSLVAFGAAIFLMEKYLKTDPKNYFKTLSNIVLLATSIMVSSHIIAAGDYTYYPSLSWLLSTGLSMLLFGGIIGILSNGFNISFGNYSFNVPALEPKKIITGLLAIIGIASTLAISSHIIASGNYETYPNYEWSLGTGLSMLLFGGLIGIIGGGFSISFGDNYSFDVPALEPKKIITGLLAIIGIASTLALSSHIIASGNYNRYPDYEWTLGVGLSVLVFGGALAGLSFLAQAVGWKNLLFGAGAVLFVSSSIYLTSLILNEGEYTRFPDYEWTLGVGLAVIGFSLIIAGIGAALALTFPIGLAVLGAGLAGILLVSGVILAVDQIISSGDYSVYPAASWIGGVGLAILGFTGLMAVSGALLPLVALGFFSMSIIASAIVETSNILSGGDYTKYPSEDWADGVVVSMKAFSLGMIATAFIPNKVLDWGKESMIRVAETIIEVAKILSSGDFSKHPSLGWAASTTLLMNVFLAGMMATAFVPNKVLDWGTESLIKIANTIVEIDKILATGTYQGGPTKEWSEGIGLAMYYFAKGISEISMAGEGLLSIFTGGGDIKEKLISLADGMKAVNAAISSAVWGSYPSKEWSEGVGIAVSTFATAISALSQSGEPWWKNALFGGGGAAGIKDKILVVADALIAAKDRLMGTTWPKEGGPSKEWAEGVGTALKTFTDAFVALDSTGGFWKRGVDADNFKEKTLNLIDGIVAVAEKLQDVGDIWTNYPKKSWVEGVSYGINYFVQKLLDIEKGDIGKGEFKILRKVINKMIETAEELSEKGQDIWSVYPSQKWIEGLSNGVSYFIDKMVEIEKSDIGKGELKILRRTIDKMINTAEELYEKGAEIWSVYPKQEWIEGVGKSMNVFIDYMSQIEGKKIKSFYKVEDLIDNIINIAETLNEKGNIFISKIDQDWINSIGNAMDLYVSVVKKIVDSGIKTSDTRSLIRTVDSIYQLAEETSGYEVSWSSYPNENWINSIGKSIQLYSELVSMIKEKGVEPSDARLIMKLISPMVETAEKLGENTEIWNNRIDEAWVQSIEKTIIPFTSIKFGKTDTEIINKIVDNILLIAEKFNDSSVYWNNYPTTDWIDNVTNAIEIYSRIIVSNTEFSDVEKTVDSIVRNANVLSDIENWNYPNTDWISNFKSSVIEYSTIQPFDFDSDKIEDVVDSISEISSKMKSIQWTFIPDEWVKKLEISINKYSTIQPSTDLDFSGIENILDSIEDVSIQMRGIDWSQFGFEKLSYIDTISNIIKSYITIIEIGKNYDMNVSDNIADGVIRFAMKTSMLGVFSKAFIPGGTIEMFGISLRNLVDSLPTNDQLGTSLDYISSSMERIAMVSSSASDVIFRFAAAVRDLSESLSDIDYKSIAKLSRFSSSFNTISMIDNIKLNQVLDTMSDRKDDLSQILDETGSSVNRATGMFDSFKNSVESLFSNQESNEQNVISTKSDEEFRMELLAKVTELIDAVKELTPQETISQGSSILGF